jgi:tripartite-type tricarboxylate transporter receptor subunit TctC
MAGRECQGGGTMRKTSTAGALAACLLIPLLHTAASAQADFFKGKTVSVVVGARAIGSLSVSAQTLTRYWGRYIPGNPTVILRQMPGGAHLNATNHVFNVAEADGLTVLAVNPQVAMAQLFKMPAVRFDVRQFMWLGSSGADAALFAIRPDLPYKTFKDLTTAKQELVIGTTGPGSNAHDVPLLLKEFAGAKFRLVSGYAANTDIKLALERKEVDGWTALATTVRLAGEQGIVRPMVRSSRAPVPGLEHIPVDEDLATSDLGRRLMVIRGTPLGIGRGFGVRPGTPADRVAILRDSLTKALADPQFLAEMKTAQIEIHPISAADVTRMFNDMINQPPEVLAAMGKYLKAGGG